MAIHAQEKLSKVTLQAQNRLKLRKVNQNLELLRTSIVHAAKTHTVTGFEAR